MASINLLPWRDSKRIRKNKQFIRVVLITSLIGVAMVASVWAYVDYLKKSQQQANDQISALNIELDKGVNQIDALEKQRDSMLAGMQIIEDLQAKRAIPVRAWNEIAKALPKQAYLTFMKREGDLISFRGKTQNPDRVSAFVRNLETMPLFEKAQVKLIKQSETPLSPSALSSKSPSLTLSSPSPTLATSALSSTSPPTQQLASELRETSNRTSNQTSNQINEVEFLVTVNLITVQQVNDLPPSIASTKASSQASLTQNTTANTTPNTIPNTSPNTTPNTSPSANSHDSAGAN